MTKYKDDIMSRESYEGDNNRDNADGRIGQAYHAIDSLARELGWLDDYHVKHLLWKIEELNSAIWEDRLAGIPEDTKAIIAVTMGINIR